MSFLDEEDDSFERTIWACGECFMYKIPPRGANGYTASEWKESDFIFKGRVRVTEQGDKCDVIVEDPANGKLFARCPVNADLDKAVERVSDSSRYFVLRVTNGDRQAFVGMGFQERNDAFDFNVALEDHKRQVERRRNPPSTMGGGPSSSSSTSLPQQPALDLGLKQGETIRVNIKGGARRNREANTGGIVLPPPPSSASSRQRAPQSDFGNANASSGFSFEGYTPPSKPSTQQQPPQQQSFQQYQQQPAATPQARNNFFEELVSAPAPNQAQVAQNTFQQQPKTGGADPFKDLFG